MKLKLAGYLYKILVDKHVSGPPLPGQVQLDGVWGTRSEVLYFAPAVPPEKFVWWSAPVYFGPEHEQ